jgi:hypothetical protein
MTLPEPKVCAGCAQVLWTPVYVVGYMLAILGRAKGHDHQAACGPSRLGAYAVRLCPFAHWRSCRWRDRTCGHRSPLVQRTSLLSLRLGMASSPLRGLVYGVRLWSLIATGAENIATIAEKAMGYAMLFPVAPDGAGARREERESFLATNQLPNQMPSP